jgi:hypothetical protein
VMSAETVNNSPERPDIYYIILDGYSSNSFLLREYGYDNSDFTDGLEGRGFFVAYDSQSNYGVTLVSLPSSLNMRYIDDEDRQAAGRYNLDSSTYLRSLIANNQVAYELKQLGYTYLYMLSGHIVPSVMADTNIAFYPEGSRYFAGADLGEEKSEGDWAYKQPFMSFFLKTTLLRSIAHRFDVQEEGEPYSMASPEMFWATLAELERVPAMEEATFTFAHFVKPHGPIIFDKYGNAIDVEFDDEDPEKARYFFDELQYLNTQILTLVDHILAQSSEPPIIILQADHGSNLGNPWDAGWRWTHFEIFNAYYFPDHATELLHPEIAPLNSFRAVFNQFFDGNYEMLESKQYTVPRGWWMGDYFTHVRYEDDRRLNVELGDQIVLIYEGVDDGGAPELDIHAVSEDGGKGELLFTIAHENISNFLETPPDQNTLITQQGQVALYALTTGEFQFNIGPDAEGREWAIIIDSLPARISYGYEVGVQ